MTPPFDKTWTLFLDRDGVINVKPPEDYVKRWEEFCFIPGTLEAIRKLAGIFGKVIVVTNQQGIGKGLYTPADLEFIHSNMLEKINESGGRIDRIYYCPDLAAYNPPCRKPNTGMAYQAKEDHPQIDFKKAVMVGDSISDMEFGKDLGMYLVYVSENISILPSAKKADCVVSSLKDFADKVSTILTS